MENYDISTWTDDTVKPPKTFLYLIDRTPADFAVDTLPVVSNVKIESVSSPVELGELCRVGISFDFSGKTADQNMRVAIGRKGATGFTELAVVPVILRVSGTNTLSKRTFYVNIPTKNLATTGLYDVKGNVQGVSGYSTVQISSSNNGEVNADETVTTGGSIIPLLLIGGVAAFVLSRRK